MRITGLVLAGLGLAFWGACCALAFWYFKKNVWK